MMVRALPVLLLVLPLAGCYSLSAPKDVPGWAMSSGAETDAMPRRTVRRVAAPRPSEEDRAAEMERLIPSDTTSINTGPASAPANGRRLAVRTQPHRMGPEKPAAARPGVSLDDTAADEQLRRQMTICRGC
jgi:hypothetical protein